MHPKNVACLGARHRCGVFFVGRGGHRVVSRGDGCSEKPNPYRTDLDLKLELPGRLAHPEVRGFEARKEIHQLELEIRSSSGGNFAPEKCGLLGRAAQRIAAQRGPWHGTSRSIPPALQLPVAQSGVLKTLPCLAFLNSFPGSWVDHVWFEHRPRRP